eukprot:SAG31_NODE_2368_length_5854_cov_19.043440_2_plen_64_part_00
MAFLTSNVGETAGFTLNLAYFSPNLNLSDAKIVYMYRVVLSPRGGKCLDIHTHVLQVRPFPYF